MSRLLGRVREVGLVKFGEVRKYEGRVESGRVGGGEVGVVNNDRLGRVWLVLLRFLVLF